MSQPTASLPSEPLAECFELARDPKAHLDAERVFAEFKHDLTSAPPEAMQVVERLWKELLLARRSAAFWEEMSNVERSMTERLAADHIQLQQNYLRLVQEQ
ncbi:MULTISPECIES: hypothetical protein [unclassified Leptolyngbya]|uniref:hypothetical protein n=1 Tax=unclassified Leptolyngbya TaxID=2650499 RepID=UPI001683F8FF|nr:MULTISPECIES: hypothetical protein [unclassified Leptolyngbya]MBD1909691.1 hypothetical protein [Leptolyngbya sp. FACHB-8]MBD2157532.1 hypothetical protein [Leptolyngbya sp. FACHB-16]